MKKKSRTPSGGAFLPFVVLTLAAFVYGLHGFDGPLYRDYGIYLYGGQRVAEGVPPYVGIFDHKGPLPVMLAGAGVALSGVFGLADVYAARLAFFIVGCLTVVAVYLLGESAFRSRAAGLFAALTFLGFYGFARPVASGPDAKVPMVLFEALSLLLMTRKKWFWAGFCGSVAFLAWQPMGVLPLVSLVLALAQPRGERRDAALRALAGAVAPLAATGAYFWYHGALDDLLDGLILFNLLHVNRGGLPPILAPAGPIREVLSWYGTMLGPLLLGLAVIVSLYFSGPLWRRYASLLFTLPPFAAWSLLDFQTPEDLYPFLPYAAVGFGAFLASVLRRTDTPRPLAALLGAALLAMALVNTPAVGAREVPGPSLQAQQRSAAEIRERFGEDARIVSINAPQVLALLGAENPDPYLFTTEGIDRQIAADVPGGFEGWIESLEAYDPDAIAFFAEAQRQRPESGMTGEHARQLNRWLDSGYRAEKMGTFWLYVKDSPS